MAVRIVDPAKAAAPRKRGAKAPAGKSAAPPKGAKGAKAPEPGTLPKGGLGGPLGPPPPPPKPDTETTGDRISQLVSDPKLWWGVGLAAGGFIAWKLVQSLSGSGAASSTGSGSGSGSGGGGGGGTPSTQPGPGGSTTGTSSGGGGGGSVGGGGGGGGVVGSSSGGGPSAVSPGPGVRTSLAAALAASGSVARGGSVRKAVGHHAVLNAGQVNPSSRYIKATGSSHYAPQIRAVRPGFGGSHAAPKAALPSRGSQARATLIHGGPVGNRRPAPTAAPKRTTSRKPISRPGPHKVAPQIRYRP